jgi:hypothetical protein
MSVLEFIASIVRSVAWPSVIVVAVILFHRPIAERIKSILKISHKDTEVSFDHEAKEVEATLASVKLPTNTRLTREVKAHASTNVGRIASEWAKIEEKVRHRLIGAGVDASSLTGAAVLHAAHERSLISGDQLRALLGLNVMRNLAVHRPEGEIDERRTREFMDLAEAINTILDIS